MVEQGNEIKRELRIHKARRGSCMEGAKIQDSNTMHWSFKYRLFLLIYFNNLSLKAQIMVANVIIL